MSHQSSNVSNMSLVIPCLTSDWCQLFRYDSMGDMKVNEKELTEHITSVFSENEIGEVERIDFRIYNGDNVRAFVHLTWENSKHVREFQDHILSDEKTKLYYSNSSYWIINPCHNPLSSEDAAFDQVVPEMEFQILQHENSMLYQELEQRDAIILELFQMMKDGNKSMILPSHLMQARIESFDPLCDSSLDGINSQDDLVDSLKEYHNKVYNYIRAKRNAGEMKRSLSNWKKK